MRLLLFFLGTTALTLWGQQPEIRLAQIATGLRSATDIQNAGDGTGRLFIVQQNGVVRIWRNGALLAAPFLDMQSKTRATGECGLLGLAFPPGYAGNQHFYVNYTDPQCRNTIVARYRVTANPNAADAGSEQILLTQPQFATNHNGGQVRFGPDGYLYVGFGDGGGGNDPQRTAQNPASWLGKMLRLDVESDLTRYRVPADNPFVTNPAFLPEIWALGLRNPWRFTFDRQTGDLWIGDVGQDRAEEVDFQPASSRGGENYGWSRMEGVQCLSGNCDRTGLVLPVIEYTSRVPGDRSVTGGFVYRGALWPNLRGLYIYADYVSGRIWGLRREAAGVDNRLLLAAGVSIPTFGEDEQGEIYLADYGGGAIYRIDGLRQPSFTSSSAVNAASFEPGLVPGSLATLFVSGVREAAGVSSASGVPLPRLLDGVRVSIGGRDAPLLHIINSNGAEQINFQVPFETTGESAAVVVSRDGTASPSVQVPLLAVQPGVFALSGTTDAILVRSNDNTLVTANRPLEAGELIYFYATGLGQVSNNPGSGNGGPLAPLATLPAFPGVTLDGIACEVLFAGLAPNFAGVYQLNIRTPPGLAAGQRELVVRANAVASKPVRAPVR